MFQRFLSTHMTKESLKGVARVCFALLAVLALAGPGHAQTTPFLDDFSGPLSSNWAVVGSSQSLQRTQFGNTPTMRRDADGTTYTQLRVDTYNSDSGFRGRKVRGIEMYTDQNWSLPATGTGGIEYEARVRVKNSVPGLVAGFFTYGYRGTYPDTYIADEVDFETLTKLGTNQVWLNIFDDWRPSPYTAGPSRSTKTTVSGLNWSNWTVYKVRWFRDRTEWLVNGVLARTEPNPSAGTPILPKDPMGVRFNLWVPDAGWTDAYDAGIVPTSDPMANVSYTFDVDYLSVRSVDSPSTPPAAPQPMPTAVTTAPPVVGTGNGLSATYYDNKDFTGTSVSRVDPKINFDWGTGSPNASIAADTWSARWTGQVQAQYSDTYTFHTVADDGIRVFVNGQLVIDNFVDQGPTESSGTIDLKAGVRYDLRVEYYDGTSGALAQLGWSSLSTGRTTIPQSQLYSATLAPVATPTFSPDGGNFYAPAAGATQSVSISSATTGATIRYTKNGAEPTENDAIIASGGSVSVASGQTLKARAWKDNLAPSGIKSATYTLVLDTQDPIISVNTPVDNYSYITLASATGTASDVGPSGLAQVTGRLQRVSDNFYWNGSAWTATATETPATGTATWTWTMPTLADGKYSFRATARDRAGNTASSPVVSFDKDETAPTVVVSTPVQNGSYFSLASASGSASDVGPGVSQVKGRLQRLSDNLYWNGSNWTSTATDTAAAGTATWTWTMPPSLAVGQYAFTASAVDFAGNTGSAPVVNFSINTVSVLSLSVNPTSVAAGNTATGTVTLSGAAGTGGVVVNLSTDKNGTAGVPASVTVPAGTSTVNFPISTRVATVNTAVTITATLSGTSRSATLTVTPASWKAQDIAVGKDNKTRMLLTNPDGRSQLWVVSADGVIEQSAVYGPYAGWAAYAIAVDASNKTRVMWKNISGVMSIWTVSATGVYEGSSPVHGPYEGWTASAIAVDANNKTRVMWNNSTTGQIRLWSVSPTGVYENGWTFG